MSTKASLDLVHAQCCICENDTSATIVGKGSDFEYQTSDDIFFAMRCPACGLVYIDPVPDVSEFGRIYPSTYHAYDFKEKNFRLIYKLRSLIERSRLLYHCRRLPDNARILDVGCGDGFHLDLLRKFGKKTWSLEGVEIDKRAVEAGKRKGLNIHHGEAGKIDLQKESYDLVLLIMTIEHVDKPADVLNAVKELLKKGGKVIIVTDNTSSIDFSFFRNGHWGGFHFPRHRNLFNRQSLSELAKKTGFEMMRINTITSPVNWVYSIHNTLVHRQRPKWLTRQFTLKSPISLAFFTVVDFVCQKLGKGALLQATLKKAD